MKKRSIYWRRKNKKIIAEGIRKGKSEYLFTLPNPEKFIEIMDGFFRRQNNNNLGVGKYMKIPSFFTKEKWEKIMEKFTRLDIKPSDK